MFGLWSMAAQPRACHCRACVRATNTVARRTTTSTKSNPRRRKIQASDVFTACYTAIMATAAVVDATRKDKRRRELDRKLAEAKSKLGALMEEAHARDLAQVVTSSPSGRFYCPPLEKLRILKSMCMLRPDVLLRLERGHQDRAHRAPGELAMALGQTWQRNLSAEWSTLPTCKSLLALEEQDPGSFQQREPKTETQLVNMMHMVNDLVDRLLAAVHWPTQSEPEESHFPIDTPGSTQTMIGSLRSDGYPSYLYPEIHPQGVDTARTRLNEVNSEILAGWKRRDGKQQGRERYVAKICYNLLVCPVPPGMQNYNLLILRFAELGEHDLAQAVVDAFLYRSHLYPTEGTFLCLLHHYRLKKDVVGFWGLVRRLFGDDPRGIGRRRKKPEEVAASRCLRRWSAATDVILANGYYVERTPLTLYLVEAMMEGLIDLMMLHEAAELFAICLQERWAISVELLRHLFHACISSLDSTAAKVIIQGVLENIGQATWMIFDHGAFTYRVVRQLHHILNICHATSPPKGDDPQSCASTNQSLKAGLRHLATAIWIKETWRYSEVMISGVERAKRALSRKDRSLSARLGSALAHLNRASELPARKLRDAVLIQRAAKENWLKTRRTTSPEQTTVPEMHTPFETQPLQQLSLPEGPLQQRAGLAMALETPGSTPDQVEICYARIFEIEKQLKIAILEACPPSLTDALRVGRNDGRDVSLERIMGQFDRYLTSLERRRSEVVVERAGLRGPFSRLLENLPEPAMLPSPTVSMG